MTNRNKPSCGERLECVAILAFFSLWPVFASGQTELTGGIETGSPFLTCFLSDEIGGGFQSWAFEQDDRGVLFVGNNLGVIEYDGASWRLIETSRKNIVRSLDRSASGRLYVGSFGEVGYIEPDPIGQLKYVSLDDFVPEEDRAYNDVWTVHDTPTGVYFLSRERLFRFVENVDDSDQGWSVKVWRPTQRFLYAFWLGGTYYVHQAGIGLMRMVGDGLEQVPGSEQFAQTRVQVLLPFGRGENPTDTLLVGGFDSGLHVYDGTSFRRVITEADEILTTSTLYKGAVLSDGTFGLTTTDAGFVVVDRTGRLIHHLDQSSGLTGDGVLALFVDRGGSVWLAPESGICQVETPSPLSLFEAGSGITAAISDITRHNGLLYVSSENGVHYLDPATSVFEQVVGITGNTQSFDLMSIDDELLVSVNGGLFKVDGGTATAIRRNRAGSFASISLHRSRQDSNRIFVGLNDGLATMRRGPSGQWTFEDRIEGISDYVYRVVEPTPGRLWLGVAGEGVIRLDVGPGFASAERLGPDQGLPETSGSSVFNVAGKLMVATKEGVYLHDPETGAFDRDSLLSSSVSFAGTEDEYSIVQDPDGNLWVNFGKETAVLRRQEDGSFKVDRTALSRFADTPVTSIYPESSGVVWFGSARSLIRYDQRQSRDYLAEYPALIRAVTAGDDSLIFGGTETAELAAPEIAFAHNTVTFQYAATALQNPKETRYQSMLEGFDDHWSQPSSESKRTYTNLPPGEYRFHARARDTFGHESSVATYPFTVLPPWYRTWWAYGFYLILLGLGVFGVDRMQRKRLLRRERERSALREAQLRAKAAEADAKALQVENEQKKNVELISEIGRDITATLSVEGIIERAYESVNALMDASVFSIGLFNDANQRLEFPGSKEKGLTKKRFFYHLNDEDRLAVWCFKNRREVVIHDFARDSGQYLKNYQPPVSGEQTESVLYLPLIYKDVAIGVMTAQSFEKNAYTDVHLNILRSIAAYAAIALDNASAYERLNRTLEDLQAAQDRLVQSEKMASLGQLTAGIAHEIKNPLNFVNNFASVSAELTDELLEEIEAHRGKRIDDVADELREILSNLKINAELINEHGQRADGIVRSMLQHSRGDTGERMPTDVNGLLEEYVNLAYHGMRATEPDFNASIERDYDEKAGSVEVIPQDIGRVLINLLNNAFYAVYERTRSGQEGYEPVVSVATKRLPSGVEIMVRDNGTGIPESVKEKIFEPFFTTKPTGSGTGLGLSMSYDIVTKGHGGKLLVDSEADAYTRFRVVLPR